MSIFYSGPRTGEFRAKVLRSNAFPVVVLVAIVCGGMPRGAESSIKLDRKKQLFLDDYFISSASNVSRQLHPAQKYSGNPVLWSDETWENGFVSLYGSVLEDEGKYRLWYQSGLGVSYAESQDGIKWIKPRLELVKYAGQATNGLAVSATAAAKGLIELSSDSYALPYFYEMFGVLKDPQEKDASRRYKLGFLSVDFEYRGPRPDPFHEGQRRGLGVAGSPDGIHWKLIDNWTTGAICDGGSHWTFDSARSKYVLYGRTKFISPSVAEGWGLKGEANDANVLCHSGVGQGELLGPLCRASRVKRFSALGFYRSGHSSCCHGCGSARFPSWHRDLRHDGLSL